MGEPAFWPTYPLHVRRAPSLPPPKITIAKLQSPKLGLHIFIPLHFRKNRLDLAQDHLCGAENAPNMVLQPVHMVPFPIMMWHDGRAEIPPISLHITGPSQCPRVDKPHAASIAGTRPAVAGRTRKDVAQMVWNCPCVADWYRYRQFSQDILYWYELQNRVLMTELVYNSRAN